MNMVDINQVFLSNTFRGDQLDGEEPVLTIKQVEVKSFDDGVQKLNLHFAEEKRTLVCNKTNAKKIAKAFGTETAQWVGKKIQLYADLVDFHGKTVEGIRVRPVKSANGPVQQKAAPEVPFDDAVADIGETF